jgi:hypothetical protein
MLAVNVTSSVQHITPQHAIPQLDPMHQTNSMIYRMGQEVGFIVHQTNSMIVLHAHSLYCLCSMFPGQSYCSTEKGPGSIT